MGLIILGQALVEVL